MVQNVSTLCLFWVILHAFLSSADFFKSNFSQISFRNTIRVTINLDAEQAQRFMGPNLGQTVCKDYQQTTLVGMSSLIWTVVTVC